MLTVYYNNISAIISYNLPNYVVNLGPNPGAINASFASKNSFSCPLQNIASFYTYLNDYFYNLQVVGQISDYMIIISML